MQNSIGIFDSGIGGVTVLREILKVLPKENYIYYSDSINNPYGDKSDKEIIEICDEIVQNLMNKGCKAIVIACNTASAKAVQFLRNKYNTIPIIAIEPAYKMVYDHNYNDSTLVLATKGTIESEKFNLLYQKYNNYKTYLCPCVGLADIIEEGNQEKLEKYLKSNIGIYAGKVHNVVLGCTHYPLVQQEIKRVLGNVKFFNGASRLAIHLKEILEMQNLINQESEYGKITFIDTSNQQYRKQKRFYQFLKEEIKNEK